MPRLTIQETKSNAVADMRWWQHKSGTRACDALWAAFKVAKAASSGRTSAYDRLRTIADRGELESVDGESDDGGIQPQCDNNVVGQVCETACAKLLENRPDAQILTDGGQDTAQMRAKELASWVNAASKGIELYEAVEEAWDDAQKVGTGAFRVFQEHGRPVAEVAYCEDMHVNPIEAKHNAVRTLYYERQMDRAALAAMFPEHKKAIGAEPPSVDEEGASEATGRTWSDMVTVVEAWRLALCPKPNDGEMPQAKAGRHAIAIDGQILHDEPYESNTLPFRFMRWRKRSRSFWGIGIPEILERQQTQLNLHAGTIEETLETLVPQTWVEAGETAQRLDNIPGRVNSGKAPAMTAAHPGLLAAFTDREQRLEERMFASVGVSRMEAQAQKPAGLNSGRAQLVHQDIKSKRLLLQGRQLEDAYAWAFRRLIDVADEIVRMGDDGDADALTYLAGEGQDVTERAYADVRISDFMFSAKVYPVSKLPDSPAGRLEFVTELMGAGVIPPEDVLPLLALPDVEGYAARKQSMVHLARAFCDHAAAGEETASLLTPMDNHAEVISYGHELFARLRLQGRSADELTELVDVVTRATDMKADAEQAIAEQAGPQMPPGPPMGPGQPPMPPAGGPPMM